MAETGDLHIHGKVYDSNDMTFREERDVRKIVRDLAEDPDVDFETLPLGDILPAIVLVLHRRDNPDYTLDEALELKQRDVLVGEETGNGNGKKVPPTRRGGTSKKSTPAASGPPKSA